MYPILPASCGASSGPPSPRTVPTQGQRPPPIHSLADVDLEKLKPYRETDIATYLKKHQVGKTDDTTFNECLFQSVLFTDFFEKIEAGEIKPGQPEPGQPEHDLPAKYLLKKSAELLKPLREKIQAASRRHSEKLKNLPTPSDLRAKLEEKLGFINGMVERFNSLERDLLHALAEPHTFRPTRDKACFLLFAHAMLADAANAVEKWMNDLAAAKPGEDVYFLQLPVADQQLVKSYLTKDKVRSNLFSPEPLTPADKKLYEKGLTFFFRADDRTKKNTIPSVSPTGSQGVLAMLHGIFHGKCLLSGATRQPYDVHNSHYNRSHLRTLRHDCEHLQIMMAGNVLSTIAPKLMPIYRKLENPESNLSPDDVKKDLVVLFYMLHENNMFSSPDSAKSFLDYARRFFCREFVVVDMIKLLNKVGFSIPAIDDRSSPEDKAACYEAVARDMNTLWEGFRKRHADDLAASGVLAKLPKFLKD